MTNEEKVIEVLQVLNGVTVKDAHVILNQVKDNLSHNAIIQTAEVK